MKTYNLLKPTLLALIFLMSYQVQAQSRNVKKVLENPEDRAYLMLKISNDKALTAEMIDYLSNNVEASEQLKAKFSKQKGMKMKLKMAEHKEGKDHPKMEMCAMCKKKMADKNADGDTSKMEMCAMCKNKMKDKNKLEEEED
jgi:hypothetical protein